MKRFFDFWIATVGLILLSPFFLVIAFVIKIDSPGPIFFKQNRIGRWGKVFSIHKFRTMIFNAEKFGLQITVGSDPRVTRVGYWLRKYKFDELPQLFDVWLGNMSLVGPRPEVPKYVDAYPESVKDIVLSVRPGITDWASIEFKDENKILENSIDPDVTYINEILPIKLNYYQNYVATHSFFGDILIIFFTFKEIFWKR